MEDISTTERAEEQRTHAQDMLAAEREAAPTICADCNTPIADDEDSAYDAHGNEVHEVCPNWQGRDCPWCGESLGNTDREPVRYEDGDLIHWQCWLDIEDAERLRDRVQTLVGEMREAVEDAPLWRHSRPGKDMAALVGAASDLLRAMTGDVLMRPLTGREIALLRLARGESEARVREALEMTNDNQGRK